MTLKTFFPSRCHLKMQMCKVARCGHGGATSVYTAFDGAHWNAIAPLALLQPLHLPINRMSLSGLMPEMPCLFLGQTEFRVLIRGGNRAADSIVWSDTLKRSRICALNGCLGNYKKPLCLHRGTIPSHLLFPSNLISIERLAAGEMTLSNHSPFPQSWTEACGGEVYWVMWPPPCLSPGCAAGKMGMQRLRSQRSNSAY